MLIVKNVQELREILKEKHNVLDIKFSQEFISRIESFSDVDGYEIALDCNLTIMNSILPLLLQAGIPNIRPLFFDDFFLRPKIDMERVNGKRFKKLPTDSQIFDLASPNNNSKCFIPVVRYNFHLVDDVVPNTNISTFYYYEPKSTFYLYVDSILTSKNKGTAAQTLGMTKEEMLDLARAYWRDIPNIEDNIAKLISGTYAPSSELMGFDVFLDDYLSENGETDVIVLTQIVDENRLSTEVIDLRSTELSSDSLFSK